MSIIDTLIIDRTQADAELARRLGAMGWAAMTDEQRALYLSDQLKGAYKASDLNRVNAAMDYLVGRLKAQGINVPIKRSKIPHKQSGGKRLPEGHNELKWIESTGTQYIDSGFIPNQDTRLVGEFEATSMRNYRFPFGVRTSTTTNAFAVASGLTQVFYNYGTTFAFANYSNTYERMVIDANKNVATFTGSETVTISLAAQTFTAEYNLLVGSYMSGGNPGGDVDGWAGKTFYTQIYDNGTLVRDYIPDMLDSGEVGLYDMVEGKFYPNAGTGVFLAGPRRVELPEGFTQVEYIESSGTQYIDTLVPHAVASKTVLSAELEFTSVSSAYQIMGFTGNTGSGIGLEKSAWWKASSIPAASVGTRYSIEFGVEGTNSYYTVNGVTANIARSTTNFTSNLFLFASLNSAGETTMNYYCYCKLYGARVLVDGVLVRDFVPCKNPSGAYGLYDMVNGQFYGNVGSGAFTYGDIVEWEPVGEEMDDYTWYDSDRPTPAQFAEYLANVSSVRSSLRAALPEIPADMDDFTIVEANNIELVLVNMEQLINNMLSAWVYCAEIYSGEV